MSIELTDDQAWELKINLKYKYYSHEHTLEDVKEWLDEFLNSLTKDQVKQLAEQHGMSCVDWAKFDEDDLDKLPNDKSFLACDAKRPFYQPPCQASTYYDNGDLWMVYHGFDDRHNLTAGSNGLTHFAEMPTPPKG